MRVLRTTDGFREYAARAMAGAKAALSVLGAAAARVRPVFLFGLRVFLLMAASYFAIDMILLWAVWSDGWQVIAPQEFVDGVRGLFHNKMLATITFSTMWAVFTMVCVEKFPFSSLSRGRSE